VLPDPANDVLSLPVAAAIAYKHMILDPARSNGATLDRLRVRISEPELLEGMFWGGAARFESRHRLVVVSQLTVKKSDLEQVLQQTQNRNDLRDGVEFFAPRIQARRRTVGMRELPERDAASEPLRT
jgi:hypothetical protein